MCNNEITPASLPPSFLAGGKNEVTRGDTRSHRSRLSIKRISSEGKTLDYEDQPVKDTSKNDGYRYHRAKTHVSQYEAG